MLVPLHSAVVSRYPPSQPPALPFRLALGYVWPAYHTFKAVEAGRKEDLRDWCIYW